ncbi:hypothetical protein PoB_000738300 [Plakobranchus ocellatus]|uniref:Uncharacterized protein n=1 Tax=Plakobranchus ocellatus TaxID=259542 RepID=A0AAV3YEM7_9GAST|nr:hypothetical protein PoB_000738300 [Plakobranchus ocellatus]
MPGPLWQAQTSLCNRKNLAHLKAGSVAIIPPKHPKILEHTFSFFEVHWSGGVLGVQIDESLRMQGLDCGLDGE